jgi:hypothetical protein
MIRHARESKVATALLGVCRRGALRWTGVVADGASWLVKARRRLERLYTWLPVCTLFGWVGETWCGDWYSFVELKGSISADLTRDTILATPTF